MAVPAARALGQPCRSAVVLPGLRAILRRGTTTHRGRRPITIDATGDTGRELSTVLGGYSGRGEAAAVQACVDWSLKTLSSGSTAALSEAEAVVSALAAAPARSLVPREWQVATGRWEAPCSTEFADEHMSLFLRVLEGTWQLVYAHRG